MSGAHTADRHPSTSGRTSRSRRIQWVGVVLVGLGVLVLCWAAWQQYLSNWWSLHRQDQVVGQLEEAWEHGASDGTVDAGGSTAAAVVRVPRFGAEYAVPVVEGTSDDALAVGLGHVSSSAGPGERGNFALAGHRIGHGEPLRDLPALEPGDEVVVENSDAVHTYVVDTDPADLDVHDTDTWVVDERPVNPDPDGAGPVADPRLLTLVTCTDLFHSDDRTAVFGHLVSSVAR